MYKHFIFDLYGTLIDLHTDEKKPELWQELAKFMTYQGASFDGKSLKSKYLADVKAKLASVHHTKYPDILISQIFANLYRAKGVEPDRCLIQSTTVLFRSLSLEYLKLYDGVMETLEWLKNRGGKIYLLSNGQREFSLPELRHLGLSQLFDGMYFSADYEVCKPDIQFIDILLYEHQINPAEAVMIGNDHTTDVEVARRSGIDSVYIHTNCSKRIKRVRSTFQIWDNNFRKLQEFFK
jgi:putative hydrolase of the HAD superfamily